MIRSLIFLSLCEERMEQGLPKWSRTLVFFFTSFSSGRSCNQGEDPLESFLGGHRSATTASIHRVRFLVIIFHSFQDILKTSASFLTIVLQFCVVFLLGGFQQTQCSTLAEILAQDVSNLPLNLSSNHNVNRRHVYTTYVTKTSVYEDLHLRFVLAVSNKEQPPKYRKAP